MLVFFWPIILRFFFPFVKFQLLAEFTVKWWNREYIRSAKVNQRYVLRKIFFKLKIGVAVKRGENVEWHGRGYWYEMEQKTPMWVWW
jgi:hypothetical protein